MTDGPHDSEVLADAGWLVKITTPAMGGGRPLERWYVAGYACDYDAVWAVCEYAQGLDAVVAYRFLLNSEITDLRLMPLEVRQYI
jgi:hypothetical protein